MGFNENLKLLLLEKSMKQADLCRMTGIQTSLMSEYINGRKSPTIGNAILIADALNISLDDLVGRKWNTCRDQKKPGEYTDELSETLNKLTEKECIFVMNEKKAGARSPGLINIHLYHFPQYHSSMISYLNQSKSVWLCDALCPAQAYIPITGQS